MSRSSRKVLLVVVAVAAVAAGVWFGRGRVHFDWRNLGLQLRAVNWGLFAAGVAAIYVSAVLRAARWRVLMGKVGRGAWYRLIASQFIGFTAVALFGRVADLARPYLIAQRTETPVATQLAVYSIERAFDLAAAAILFSLTLALAPRSMPHHETFARAGGVSLVATAALAGLALAVRFAGEALAGMARRWLCIVSKEFAAGVAAKVLDFRQGLLAIATAGQMFAALGWSLVLWGLIASAYFTTVHAFRSAPLLAGLTVPATMLLMATSMGGSLLQLPVLGWFTQIGVLATALHLFFGVPVEVASACGALLMFVTTLAVVPGGLIAAKLEGVGLREATRTSEVLEEEEASVG